MVLSRNFVLFFVFVCDALKKAAAATEACWQIIIYSIPLPCAQCDNSLPFSGASSVPLCYVLFSCHPSPPTILLSSFTSSSHLFLGLLLNLLVPKFIYNTLLGILFYSILCTCPNQLNLVNLIVYYSRFLNTRMNFFTG